MSRMNYTPGDPCVPSPRSPRACARPDLEPSPCFGPVNRKKEEKTRNIIKQTLENQLSDYYVPSSLQSDQFTI